MMNKTISLYLKHKWNRTLNDQANPVQAQERAFQKLKKNLAGTEIYEQNLSGSDNYIDYAKNAKVQRYKDFEKQIKRVMYDKEQAVLFNDELQFVGLSSGTTTLNSKTIPFNRKTIKGFLSFQTSFSSIIEQHSNVRVLRDSRLTWGSTPLAETTEDGIPCGYVSGFLASKTPRPLAKKNFPSQETQYIEDMMEKIGRTSKEVKNQDIRMLAGVPTYLINLLEELRIQWGVKDFSEIWPNLETVVYSATAIDPYKEQLEKLIGRPLNFIGCYASTEGAIGYEIPSINGNQNGIYSFHFGNLVYTFRRLGEEDESVISLADLREGDEVEVLISSSNGLLNYSMGDCIRIASIKPHITFEIIGRVGQGLNIATEKVQISELQKAVKEASVRTGKHIEHFFVHPGKASNDRPCYEWTLLVDDVDFDADIAAKALDETLSKLNPDYEEARTTTLFLEKPIVHLMPSEIAQIYFKKYSHKGQLKMKTAFDTVEKFNDFMEDLLDGSSKMNEPEKIVVNA